MSIKKLRDCEYKNNKLNKNYKVYIVTLKNVIKKYIKISVILK